MSRLLIFVALVMIAGGGWCCDKEATPELSATEESPEPAPSPSVAPLPPGPGNAALQSAIDTWRAAPAVSGTYRSVVDSGLMADPGRASRPDGPRMVMEGTFSYQSPDMFRSTGTQSMGRAGELEEMARVDVLFKERNVTLSSKASKGLSSEKALRIGSELFIEGEPFSLKTSLNGTPFASGDIAALVERLLEGATFEAATLETVGGESLQVYLGRSQVEHVIDRLIERRSQDVARVLQLLAKDADDELLEFQLRILARALVAQQVMRVYVDSEGWIRGWDAGPKGGVWLVSMRLDDISPRVEADAFALDPAVEERMVDQTPALKAQVRELRQGFADTQAVSQARSLLLEAYAKHNIAE